MEVPFNVFCQSRLSTPTPLPLITLLTMSGTWDLEEAKMAAEGHACLKPELSSVSIVCFELQYRGLNG